MKDLMINSNANKTFSDIPPFMIKTSDKMSALALALRVAQTL